MEKASLYQKRKKIHPKIIKGRSNNFRLITAFIIYGAFFGLPWLQWGENPAIFFDLAARQFHIFGLTFWPQDFMFLAWGLIIAAFSLFLFTTVAGRLWCGYACPQTIWTLAFVWVEQKIEGLPHQRRHLDEAPISTNKLIKRVSKHAIWLIMAFLTGATFVSYFYPVREMVIALSQADISLTAMVWISIFTYLTYIDAAWLREQVCIYMCPYARFQSVMYDKDTLLVSYHPEKGEPRSSIKSRSENHGGCIDCKLCVQVCPTGIDIREGQQIDCINCGLCEDACKDIMEQVGQPADLITFTTLNQLEGKKPLKLIRPKTIAYCTILAIMTGLLAYNLITRTALEASVLRDRDTLYETLNSGEIANRYTIKAANKSGINRSYQLSIEPSDYRLETQEPITIEAGELIEEEVRIITTQQLQGSRKIIIRFDDISSEQSDTIETRFIYPPR